VRFIGCPVTQACCYADAGLPLRRRQPAATRKPARRYEDVGLAVGVDPEDPSPDTAAPDPVSDGVAEGLDVSLGEPDPVEVPEEEIVGVGLLVVGVGDGDDVVGVGVGDCVPVSVVAGVAVGLMLVVGPGVLDGVAAGQVGAAVAE
jgi:hypothetical protein